MQSLVLLSALYRSHQNFALSHQTIIDSLSSSALQDAGGYGISRQNNLELKFELPYLLIELFYIGIPVVHTDGWAYGHVITNFSQMGRLPHYLTWCSAARASRARAPL